MKDRETPTRGWRGARLAGIAATIASTIVIVSAAVAAPGGEKGKPESKPQTTQETQGNSGNAYGQQKAPKPAPEPQAQSSPPPDDSQAKAPKPKPAPKRQSQSQSDAPSQSKAQSPSTGVEKSNGASPKQSRDAGTGDNPQGRGPSGKTQYCHATHSETNPYVLIETNNNALPAHRAHQDEEDIIPATSDDCPGGSARGQGVAPPNGSAQNDKAGGPDGKATYCHSTRSETNPFVTITTSVNALAAHVRHHAGDDIIPPETGDCSGGTQQPGGTDQAGGRDGKVTYCHSTRSETNPFVTITTSVNALAAHVRHHAGDDIIPPETGECPGTTTDQVVDGPVDQGSKGDAPLGDAPLGDAPLREGPQSQRPVEPEGNGPEGLGPEATGPEGNGPQGNGPEGNAPAGPEGNGPAGSEDADEPAEERIANQRAGDDSPGEGEAEGDVLGEDESSPGDAGPGDDGSAPAVAEETAGGADDDGDSLPFTGLGLVAILAAALLALGTGLTMRRVARRQEP